MAEWDKKWQAAKTCRKRLSATAYHRSSEETVNFLRPRRRRDARTLRPFAVDILSRNPCLLTRLRLEG